MQPVRDKLYIKFKVTRSTLAEKKKNLFYKKIITKILFFKPKGNPDFDDLIDGVSEWHLEINTHDNLPNREVGLNQNGQVILIMPWHNTTLSQYQKKLLQNMKELFNYL